MLRIAVVRQQHSSSSRLLQRLLGVASREPTRYGERAAYFML